MQSLQVGEPAQRAASLPGDFPAWQTVYSYFRRWKLDGTWIRIHRYLRDWIRLHQHRRTSPSVAQSRMAQIVVFDDWEASLPHRFSICENWRAI